MRRSGNGGKALGDLLQAVQSRFKAPEGAVIEVVVEVVADITTIPLSKEMVSYTPHNRTLYIKARGPIRSEILQHKEEILRHCTGRLGIRSAPQKIV